MNFLCANHDVFTWKPSDMLDIPREVAEHALRVVLGSKLAKQRLRCFDDERRRAIGEEITKLLAAGFIREVFHSDGLANPVLAEKRSRSGECASITPELIKHVRRITFLYHA